MSPLVFDAIVEASFERAHPGEEWRYTQRWDKETWENYTRAILQAAGLNVSEEQ